MAEVTRTVDIPRAGELVSLALHSTITAVRTMPALFGSAALISVVIKLADILSDYGAENLSSRWGVVAAVTLWGLVSLLLNAVVLAPVAVAVHRQVLREETTAGVIAWRHPRIWRFAAWSLLVEGVMLLMYLPVEIGRDTILEWLAIAAFGVIGLIVTIRWLLIFPAIAVEAPAANWKARILTSWDQTRGYFWRLLFGLLGAVILLFLPVVLIAVTIFLLALLSESYQFVYAVRIGVELLSGAVQPFSIAIAASVASWFYMAIEDNDAVKFAQQS